MDRENHLLEPRQDGAVSAPPPFLTTNSPIPLSTIYTPPSSCNDIVTYDGTTLWQNGISQIGDPACYPPSFGAIYNSWYTPGVCPRSWKSVGQISHSPGVSDAMCCPSNYFLSTTSDVPSLNNFCFSLMTAPLTNVYPMASMTTGPLPSNPSLITLSTNQVSSTTVYADVIQIQWKSTDTRVIALMSQTASSSTASATPSSTTTTTATGTPAAKSSTPKHDSTDGLSNGSKAGIGVGVPIAVVAIAALVALLFISRRRRKHDGDPRLTSPIQERKYTKPLELHSDSVGQATPAELDAADVSELPGTEMTAELPGKSPSGEAKAGGFFLVRKKTPKETVDGIAGSVQR